MKKFFSIVWWVGLFILGPRALANTQVQFTNKELDAAFTLIRPELNTIVINRQSGVFTPSPALKFLGIDEQKFDIDFKGIINLADIEFDGLKVKTPTVHFESGAFVVQVPLEDKSKVMHSNLGTLSIQGVVATATLQWRARTDGSQMLVLVSSRVDGNISGTGILKPAFIIDGVRKLIVKTMNTQMNKILNPEKVQDSIQKGLATWAKFYSGIESPYLIPGSIQFFNSGSVSGLQFTIE